VNLHDEPNTSLAERYKAKASALLLLGSKLVVHFLSRELSLLT